MKYSEVSSSAISAIGYDEPTGNMEVIFTNGSTVLHGGVEKSVYDRFMSSESKGKAYAEMFRKKQDQPKQVAQNFKIG